MGNASADYTFEIGGTIVKQRRRMRMVIFILICSLLMLTSCRAYRRPQQPAAGAPAIPEAIAQGERQEPTLRVYVKATGKIQEMKLEDYIAGVVAAEMDPKWPVEALAAQAILARTFTLEKIDREGGVPARNAHASTDIEEFQAYDAKRINDNVRQAVQRTRGVVAAYNGKYIRAWFHAHSGGKTATAQDGLAFNKEATPYVVSVDDAISQETAPPQVSNWTAVFSKDEIREALRKIGQNTGDFSRVDIVRRSESGRAASVRIGKATVSGPALRLALGSTKLKSTLLDTITVKGDKVVFQGRGYGHGVGMSQWGAKGRADKGAKAADIIKAYFRGVALYKIWD